MRALTFLAALALVACGDADDGVYALPETDAGTDATTDVVENCDEDGDGFESAACGGPDCCDQDPNAHPGQTTFFDKPNACGGWDYDCSGSVEVEHDLPAAECRREGRPDGVACVGSFWEGDLAWRGTEAPGCGEVGVIMTGCSIDAPSHTLDHCTPKKPAETVQRCR